MHKYIIKRLIYSVIIFFFVMLIIYVILRCLPTSYIERVALQKSMQPNSKSYEEWMAQLTAMYGMDKGYLIGYVNWLGNFFTGNFGDSWFWTVPVVEEFHKTIWLSFIMGVITMFFELIIAIPLGIVAATKQYSKTDYAVSIIASASAGILQYCLIRRLFISEFVNTLPWANRLRCTSRAFITRSFTTSLFSSASCERRSANSTESTST